MASQAVWRLLKRGSWRARIEFGELKRASTVLYGSCWLNWLILLDAAASFTRQILQGLVTYGKTDAGLVWVYLKGQVLRRNECPLSQLSLAQLVVQSHSNRMNVSFQHSPGVISSMTIQSVMLPSSTICQTAVGTWNHGCLRVILVIDSHYASSIIDSHLDLLISPDICSQPPSIIPSLFTICNWLLLIYLSTAIIWPRYLPSVSSRTSHQWFISIIFSYCWSGKQVVTLFTSSQIMVCH